MGGPDSDQAERDSSIIERSLHDPLLFGVIFTRHAESVYRYLARRVDASARDDVHSETFVTAFRNRRSYDLDYPDARPWLFGVATNVVHHHRRSEGRRLALVARVAERTSKEHAGLDTTDDVVDADELHRQLELLHTVLPRMEEKYLDVLLLFTGPQLSYDDIARALAIPIGTVRSRLSRGRAQLRELLATAGQYQGEAAHVVRRPIGERRHP